MSQPFKCEAEMNQKSVDLMEWENKLFEIQAFKEGFNRVLRQDVRRPTWVNHRHQDGR